MAFLKTQQVATYCGVTERTVKNWLSAGRLHSTSEHMIDSAELVDFMHQNLLAIPVDLLEADSAASAPVLDKQDLVIIDEERATAALVLQTAEQLGLKAYIEAAKPDISRMCREQRPALVTLELSTRNFDSFKFIDELKSNPNYTGKILVISDAVPSLLKKAKDLGADVVISKPIDVEGLRRAMRIMMANPQDFLASSN